MCVRIFKSDGDVEYDMEKPLETQIEGSYKVVINYNPQDPSIPKFMDEIQRCGLSVNMEIMPKVEDIAKALIESYERADRKLEQISNQCFGKLSVR